MKILIVEDEELLSESLCELLAAHGFETEAVYDGETGLEYGLLAVYDLIILDIMLPGMDGFETARRLRAKHMSTPILMLTARSGVEAVFRGWTPERTTICPSPLTCVSCWPA